jgi:glutathione synthase/RimK-type ligase-like ATP-grasp enzyme
LPQLSEDDQILASALRERDAEVEAAVWDDSAVEWSAFDLVVIRSTWDYHKRHDEFVSWVERMAAMRILLWNSARVVLGNLHKRYLLDLEARGIPVIPTMIVPRGTGVDVQQVLRSNGWRRAIVKPAVSATAYRTIEISESDGRQEKVSELNRDSDTLIQPFVEQVVQRGEWSFIFFDGLFSHAALKRPTQGDFRVQGDFGGTSEPARPDEDLVSQAQRVTTMIQGDWLYARVDGVERGDRLMLMELELTEPSLFFALDPGAAGRFADALLRCRA